MSGSYTLCEGCGERIDKPDDPSLVRAAEVVRTKSSIVGIEEHPGQRVVFHRGCWEPDDPDYMLDRDD